MRLINVNTFRLEEFFHETIPAYAILSHTWGNEKDEISFHDIENGSIEKGGIGWKKLKGCCDQARRDGFDYAWADTCCIDKASAVELSEAINSMFQWYRNASACYAYLSDVPFGDSPRDSSSKFFFSRWFQRGWTLQELLAPRSLSFYDSEWACLGSKQDLSSIIERITGIPRPFLLGIAALHEASIAQRMSWASNRVTKRKEDMAYCLLGIFGVSMAMIYGEGDQAFTRLQNEIMKNTRDESILAWGLALTESKPGDFADMISAGALAASPSDFANCGHIVSREYNTHFTDAFTVVGGCVQISLSLLTTPTGETFGLLNCGPEHNAEQVVGIPLGMQSMTSSGPSGEYIRPQGLSSALLPCIKSEASTQLIYIRTVRQNRITAAVSRRNWFYIDESDLQLIEVEPPDRWGKNSALIATANDAVDETIQRTWTRFRPREGCRDFLVLLEFEVQTVEARCHMMVSSRDTALKKLAQRFTYMRKATFGKQSANNGTISVDVTVKREMIARQPMFVVRLATIPTLPDVTVDATLELRLLELKIDLVGNAKDEDKIRLEAEGLGRQREKMMLDLDPVRRRLAAVEDEIKRLQNERVRLIDGLEKGLQRVDEVTQKEKKVREQQADHSERRLWTQRRLDDLLQDHFDAGKAPSNGYESIVKLLLATGNIGGDLKVSDDQPPLSWAAANGYAGVVKLLLAGDNIEPEATSKDGHTALHWAASEGHEAVVQLLLEAHAEVDSKDTKYHRTPLLLAAWKGHEAVVKLLLAAKAEVDSKDTKYGRTALLHAAHNGHEAVVSLLLEAHAEVDAKDTKYGRTPLSWAAGKGHAAVIKLLLDKGADIDSTATEDGRTSLLHASHNGHEAVVKLLLEKGADIDSKDKYGRTPLLHAARNGHEAVVKLLLEKVADVDSKDRYCLTPMLYAACNGHEAVVEMLLEKGANFDSEDGYGLTPLSRAAGEGYEAAVKLLLEKGADIDSKHRTEGMTPLLYAAHNGREAVVKLLLERGADMNLKDAESGKTPLLHAALGGHEAVIKLLLEKGADIDAKDNFGWTPLFHAARNGFAAAVKMLLEKGAAFDSKDAEAGGTPLLHAAGNGHEAVVKMLLEKGADIGSKDKDGWTPFTWAAKERHESVAKLLQTWAETRNSS